MILKVFYLFMAASTVIHETESAPDTNVFNLFHDSNGIFSIYLYSNLTAYDGENLLISPASLNCALTAASLGTGGNSLKQLRTVLNQPDDQSSIISSYRNFIENYVSKKDNLTLVTQIFIDQQFQIKNKFKAELKHGFDANVENVDFAIHPEDARQIINKYVDKETNHVIKEVFEPGSISNTTKSLIVNAVFFQSEWKIPFAESETKKRPFYGLDRAYVVDMMFKAGQSIKYLDNKEINAQIIELPYKTGYSLLIILPRQKNVRISEVEYKIRDKVESSSSSPFIDIFKNATWEEVDVSLPKFEFNQNFLLKGILGVMGLYDIFGEKANFDNLSNEKVYLSDVIQKTHFAVNERGTLASAAPGPVVNFTPTESQGLKANTGKIIFNANYPFLYVIKIEDTNSPLFIGKYVKPNEINENVA